MSSVKFNRLIRVLQILLVLTLLLSVCLIASACKCEHEYKSEVTRKATCVSTGEMTYTCAKCDDVYTEEIPVSGEHALSEKYIVDGEFHYQACENCDYTTAKTAHEFKAVEFTEPSTCTKQGNVVKSCVCGEVTTETLPLAQHTFTKTIYDNDEHWIVCAVCNAENAALSRTPHNYDTVVSIEPSTCLKQGEEIKSCVCGKTHTETLPLAQHRYTKLVFNDDEHWFVCVKCNAENAEEQRIPHNLSTVTTAAECEKAGKSITSCTDCDYDHTEVLPALNHDLNKEGGFSSSPTGSGHYYQCNRCGKDVAESHTLQDCECPDGNNRAATCYKAGHQDQQCEVCNWRNHFSTPMTDDHNWSDEWTSNGTFHWHACLNGNGLCTSKSDETQHTWTSKTIPATCEENGREWRECSYCGHVQSGSNKILKATGHDNETVGVTTPATCTEAGEAEQRCKTCGATSTVAIKALGHTMSAYNMERTDVNGHYRQCSVCGFTRETPSGHTWQDQVEKEATCTSDGLTIRTCEFCEFTYKQVTTKNHNYITDPDSYVDATCTEYGTHVGICSECGDAQTFIDKHLGYAEHSLEYFPAKEMTETEAGNRNYWQCQVCSKYFSSKDCHEELTEDQVFIYPPKVDTPQTIAQLIDFAASIPEDEQTYDAYQITATITEVNSSARTIGLDDGTASIYVSVVARENLSTLSENLTITLKGNLYRLGDEVTLVDCEIVSVSREEGWYSLFFSVSHQYDSDNEFYSKAYVYAYDTDLDETYFINTNNYNCLADGSELEICIQVFVPAGNVLQKVIVNGKATTVTDGSLSITVTEDVRVELVFAATNKCSVRISELDTRNNNQNAIIVDEYVSYTYVGQYNDDGRILANSHLTFTANNANITGINITYDAAWLELHPEVLNNVIKAIKSNGVEVAVTQSEPNKNSQVVITLSGSDAYTALDYFTIVSQARVSEIIINYETLNSTQS